jgi:hypothetical protein
MWVDQPDFMRIVLLTEFLTHIHQRKSRTMQQVLQGFGTIYIERHRRVLEITTDQRPAKNGQTLANNSHHNTLSVGALY